ncbi:hypothetical protein [Amycolatopsis sp. Poz14]|uniref:hypothetical protein n=1 Tax=Amycolatopsis sp. Poz14 TaxID=1447705 RepID=UPI001EE82245|nr:hypothetical protein [Amycolatopsis sp. Poz14]MCG3754764.1 hypothetical protein [Amycolatopsis sp. Poz14]
MTHLQRAFATPGAIAGQPAATNPEPVLAGLTQGDSDVVALQPRNAEFLLWQAVVLARAGRIDDARNVFGQALTRQPALHDLPQRLASAGFLTPQAAQRLGSP